MHSNSTATGAVIFAAALSVGAFGPQSTPAAAIRPTFEVASVRPNRSGERGINNRLTPAQTRYINIPVRVLISIAYDITHDRLLGGPDWIGSDRFDVAGTHPAGTTFPQIRLMLQRLLEDRFALIVRRESRVLPVYVLEIAHPDGRLGSGLRPSSLDCSPRNPPQASPCRTSIQPGEIDGSGTDWGFLNLGLQLGLDRPVVDRTGLSGFFDVRLKWSSNGQAASSADSDRVSPFTAVREQLGLKLEPGRAPLDVLVVERVQHPTSD